MWPVTAVLARLLSPREYGVLGAALIVVAVGNTLANLGMSQVWSNGGISKSAIWGLWRSCPC